MDLWKGQIIDLEIYAIAFGGAGIGKFNGMTVFVERVVPGDKIKAAFTAIKKKYAEAKLVEIVEPSKDRVKTKCPYTDICHGCHFQFLDYKKQLEIKKQQTIDAFERIGKIKNPPVADIIPCKDVYYYRNKMEFSFGYDGEMNFALGLHAPNRKFDILDLKECHLESEFSYKILNAVRDFVKEHEWLPFKYSVGEGFLKNLVIREGKRTNEVMVILVTSDQYPDNFENDKKEFVEMLLKLKDDEKKITSIYQSIIISKRGVPRQIKDVLLHGKKTLSEKLVLALDPGGPSDELDFEILPQAFFQVNTFQAEILYGEVVKLVEGEQHKMIFDLFCGTGTIGLFLAKHAEEVLGIELNTDAVKVAQQNAIQNKIFNISFYNGDVTKVLDVVRSRPNIVVVDPPRAGLTDKIIKKINDFGANKIIYVSCNPSTLARDCEVFGQYGYNVKSVQPVDMFPHSYHIENVCLLER